MTNSPYIVRNYRPTDFDKYVLLNIEAEKLEPPGCHLSHQVITERLGRPNYYPEQNLFLVEIAGNIIGYMDVIPELVIRRVILECWVYPSHRRKGLATELFNYAKRRAKELEAKVAHVNIMEDNVVTQSMLSRLGFECVRQFLELRLDVAEIHWQNIDQAALSYRHLQRGEEAKLTQIQNRSFAGSWGYNPNTVEEIVYRINLSHCSPEDVVLTYDRDTVISYCWTRITSEAPTCERKGQILMLGVDPDYRGRGVGKRILLAGLSYLKSKGLRVVEVTVDSKNKEACALYRSVGFKIRTSTLWYEKIID